MLKIIHNHKLYLCTIVLLMIFEPSINAILNFWLQKLFNSASIGADMVYIFRLLTVGFLLWVLKRVITHVMLLVRDRFICNVKADLKQQIFHSILSLNSSSISNKSSVGEYISLFTNDILLLEQRFLNQIMGLISGVFSILILGYSFISLNSKIAFAIIIFGFSTMFVPLLFSKRLNTKNLLYTKKIANFTQKLKEYISSFPTIKNFAIETEIEAIFNDENCAAENSKFDADCSVTLANSVGQIIAWFMQFIGVGLGLVLVIKGEIMTGTVIAAQGFAGDLALPIQNVIININAIRSVKSIVDKINKFIDGEGTDAENAKMVIKDLKSISNDDGYDLEFDSVSLCLNGNNIIENFTYKFEKGKKYLVIGMNGSGKSSIFKVLKKWYKSSSGEVRINGYPLSCYSNDELSNLVSYLNESVSLFSGTLKDNVTLFKKYEERRLTEAMKFAQINLDVNRFIDENNVLSSGEQRRIEIARCLLKSASIMIFDEVVSTLDVESAYEIEDLALNLLGKTVIFISHNFSGKLIKKYDEIIIMNKGKIITHGTYEELINTSEYFQKICNIKFG